MCAEISPNLSSAISCVLQSLLNSTVRSTQKKCRRSYCKQSLSLMYWTLVCRVCIFMFQIIVTYEEREERRCGGALSLFQGACQLVALRCYRRQLNARRICKLKRIKSLTIRRADSGCPTTQLTQQLLQQSANEHMFSY